MRNVSRLLVISLVLFSCGKKEPPAAPKGTGPGQLKIPSNVQSAIDSQKEAGAKKLNDELLDKFAIYRQEMLSSTKLAMDIATRGFQAGGGDSKKMEQAVARDERLKAMNEANDKALKKSGLTMVQVAELTGITTEYYARKGAISKAGEQRDKYQKNIEKAKAAGKQPSPVDVSMAEVFAKQVNEFDAYKKEFASKYGENVVTLLEKHAPAYLELQQKQMEAVMGSFKKPQPPKQP